ncbi:MAG: acetylglutamate kinase [Pseudomonadota bacterium]
MSDEKLPIDGTVQAELLSNALPYMQAYGGKSVVIKYGGHAMGDAELGRAFARDVALLHQSGVEPVVIHGGGPQIGSMLEKLGIVSEFRDGMRVTDKATVEIVEMVLAGSINKGLVADFNAQGARAIGLCGKDGNMVRVARMRRTKRDPNSNIEAIVDLGFVGEPEHVDVAVLHMVADAGLIPVVAPVAFGADGETYNVNADTFAGAVAGALDADRLLFLTDVPGVLDKGGNLIPQLTVAEARALIADGTISGGMIPKVETCIDALDKGVGAVVIVNGRVAHAVLLELFTDVGAGTMIVPNDFQELQK